MRAFTPRAIAGIESSIRELSTLLLDTASECGELELVSELAAPLPLMVIARMFGAPVEEYRRFRAWSDDMLSLAAAAARSKEAEQAVRAYSRTSAEMASYLAELSAQSLGAPRADLLSALLTADLDGERLGQDDLLGFFQLLLLAGHETTTNLIANAVLCLTDHPRQRGLLTATPTLLSSAIEEVLRYRSPVQGTFRKTRRAVAIAGQTIPADAHVLLLIGSANRDPAVFAHADRFDIARTPNPHLSFGHGIHFCLGAVLARLEARIVLSDLLRRFPDLERASAEPWPPRKAFHVHGPTRLPLRFTPAPRLTRA